MSQQRFPQFLNFVQIFRIKTRFNEDKYNCIPNETLIIEQKSIS